MSINIEKKKHHAAFSSAALISNRVLKGLTQEGLARLVGKSRGAIGNWETGRTRPSASSLRKLAQAFGQGIDVLIEDPGGKVAWQVKSRANPPLKQLEKYRLDPDFPIRLITSRELAGMTREELARKVGTTESAIGNWEIARNRPSPPNLKKLAQALGRSVSFLLIGEEREPVVVGRAEPPAQQSQTRLECERHFQAFLDRCAGDERKLGWTLFELRSHFPVDKWERQLGVESSRRDP
jgi:transcriptional regulator with XRE-family HTH domain